MARPPAKPPICAPAPGIRLYHLTKGDLVERAFGWFMIGLTLGWLLSEAPR